MQQSDEITDTPLPAPLSPPALLPAPLSPMPQPLAPPSPHISLDEPLSQDETEIATPELEPELLQALGDTVDDIPVYGPSIHEKLAQRWLPILKKGLQSEIRDKLLKEYAAPENCKLLKAPTLNPEISAAVGDIVRARDKKMQLRQDQLGLGITAINRATSLLLSGNDKVQAIKMMSDGCRILTDLHFAETQVRVKLITPGLDKSSLVVIQDQERDETLFGNTLPEKIKALKAIERQGNQIKKGTNNQKLSTFNASSSVSRPRVQGNWSGPPRYQTYQSSSRGGRGGSYRGQYRRATLATSQQSSRPSTSTAAPTTNNRRAPTRH